MKKLLVHREGQSGRFFLTLLENLPLDAISFRISDHYQSKVHKLCITHEIDFEKHSKQYDLVLRILPTKKIYPVVYNNFMKKLIVEQGTLDYNNWRDHLVAWYDICYYNITEYYQLIEQDIAENQYKEIIDFDRLLDEDYMDHILQKYFSQGLDDNRKSLLDKYRSLQIKIKLDGPEKNMADIVRSLDASVFENNPWFFSYCIHRYEKNNGFQESDRRWSINDITTPQTKENLLEIAQCYQKYN